MKVELPLSIKKHIKFVENALNIDKKDKRYLQIIHRMQLNKEVYNVISKRKNEDVEKVADKIQQEIMAVGIKYRVNKWALTEITKKSVNSKNDMRRLLKDMTIRCAEFYYDIGKIMEENGMLDILLKRTNTAFSCGHMPYIQVKKSQAIEEFDKTKNQNTTYYILNMKTLFQVNKIIKFIDSLEYGAMLDNDQKNSYETKEEKIGLISNLKTEYLRKVLKAQETMTEKELKLFKAFEIAKREYKKIFSKYFKNLNYEEELNKVAKYEERKDILYEIKSNLISQLIGITYENTPRNKFEKGIKNCGVTIDENGKLLLGMNIYGYIMPLTVHIQKTNILDMIEGEKAGQEMLGKTGTILIPKVEKYNSLFDKNGKIFTSNLLFKTNETQRNNIKNEFKNKPNDPVIAFMNSQITSKEENPKEYLDVNELL